MIAGYVQCQDGRKWNKMWYQIKKDCVLYKFKAHEVSNLPLYTSLHNYYLLIGHKGYCFYASTRLCSGIRL